MFDLSTMVSKNTHPSLTSNSNGGPDAAEENAEPNKRSLRRQRVTDEYRLVVKLDGWGEDACLKGYCLFDIFCREIGSARGHSSGVLNNFVGLVLSIVCAYKVKRLF